MSVFQYVIVGGLCFLVGYWFYDWFSFVNKSIDKMSKCQQLQYNVLIGMKAKVLVFEKALESMGITVEVVSVEKNENDSDVESVEDSK